MIRRTSLIASCLALGCAQSIPGVDPPVDEVFYPIGITVIPDTSGNPAYLAVMSSNFDQRYNSGTINAYSIEALFEVTAGCTPDVPVCIFEGSESLRPAQRDSLRIFSFGGDLVFTPTADPAVGHLFVSARGRNRLTMVNVSLDGSRKLLSCSTDDDSLERVVGSDCTRAYVVNTGFADPFTLAYAPATTARPTDIIAVGHVSFTEQNNVIVGAVSVADVSIFEDRVIQEETVGEGEGFPEPVRAVAVASFGGVSGMAFAGDIFGLTDVFLGTTLRSAPESVMAAFRTVNFGDGYELELRSDLSPVLPLTSEISATEMRALAVGRDATGAATRAYASVRFPAPGDSYNAGIAVIDLTRGQLEILSVIEVGEELQRPFLYDVPGTGRRLLYVGDIRLDKVYVLDVTTDQPILVKEINGRGTRMIDGKPVQANLLDGPSQMAFVTFGARTLAFVTNFTNSTLAVLDVTDPDPRMHRIAARLGRNIDPEGEMEKP